MVVTVWSAHRKCPHGSCLADQPHKARDCVIAAAFLAVAQSCCWPLHHPHNIHIHTLATPHTPFPTSQQPCPLHDRVQACNHAFHDQPPCPGSHVGHRLRTPPSDPQPGCSCAGEVPGRSARAPVRMVARAAAAEKRSLLPPTARSRSRLGCLRRVGGPLWRYVPLRSFRAAIRGAQTAGRRVEVIHQQ